MYRLVITLIFFIAGFVPTVSAQTGNILARADSLMKAYRFEEALDYLEGIPGETPDSTLQILVEEKMLCCRNGLALTEFVSTPKTVAKKDFHKDEFLMYLPMKDRSWRFSPNTLVKDARDDYQSAFYYPDGQNTIMFTDKDDSGAWNIFSTERINDTLWNYPRMLNEALVTAGNELYPVISPDGKNLYFASDGMYGIGGYDLYVSRLDEATGEWGRPENLGFPFSSPYNDILFAISDDEQYYILVSDREASGDSVTVYIMEYEPIPVKKRIREPERLARLSSLEYSAPAGSDDAESTDKVAAGKDMNGYSRVLREIQSIKDSIGRCSASLENLRKEYAVSENDKENIYSEIVSGESEMSRLSASLEVKNRELKKIEMDFLTNGIIVNPEEALAAPDEGKPLEDKTQFRFSRHRPGSDVEIMVNAPVKKFDYSFQILPQGRFAEDNRLPAGLVYQIQIFASASPAGVKHLNGLSPVFERNPSRGKYIYSVGLFSSYDDALANLGKVKSRGFKSAFITAFLDGERISTTKARGMEKDGTLTEYMVCILSPDGELGQAASSVIRGKTSKDILRASTPEGVKYIIGPFRSRNEAEAIAAELIAADVEGVSVEEQ